MFIDDYTIITWESLLNEKSREFEQFKAFKAHDENEIELKIKCLRSQNVAEFTWNEFNSFCETHGIKRQLSTPRTPQKHCVVECKNITLQEETSTMLKEDNIPDIYWREAMYTSIYILNKEQLRLNHNKTPYE